MNRIEGAIQEIDQKLWAIDLSKIAKHPNHPKPLVHVMSAYLHYHLNVRPKTTNTIYHDHMAHGRPWPLPQEGRPLFS